MKSLVNFFFMTLVVFQGLFIFLFYMNVGMFMEWVGEDTNYIRLFLPLIIYGVIKVLYWFADPISKLFTIILNWLVILGIFYFLYWLFFS
jgi:hypothetical protein